MLPKRLITSILTALLMIFIVMVGWMYRTLTSPEVKEAVARKKAAGQVAPPIASVQPLPTSVANIPQFSSGGVDLELQARADRLHSDEHGPEQDLQIVAEFLETYARGTGSQPIGENADITAAITGNQYPGQKGRVFPKNHRTIRNGQLTDRWGEPFWFHPNSGNQMEIRSAGPDKQMFTTDDIILNPSPGGFGATPPGTPETPQ